METEHFQLEIALQKSTDTVSPQAQEEFQAMIKNTGGRAKETAADSNWKKEGRPRSPYYYPRV